MRPVDESAFERFLRTLPKLTWTEERLMHALWSADGGWVSIQNLLRAGWHQWYRGESVRRNDDDDHLVRVNICRLRKKLSGSVWQISAGSTGHEPGPRSLRPYVGCYCLSTARESAA